MGSRSRAEVGGEGVDEHGVPLVHGGVAVEAVQLLPLAPVLPVERGPEPRHGHHVEGLDPKWRQNSPGGLVVYLRAPVHNPQDRAHKGR